MTWVLLGVIIGGSWVTLVLMSHFAAAVTHATRVENDYGEGT